MQSKIGGQNLNNTLFIILLIFRHAQTLERKDLKRVKQMLKTPNLP